MVVLDVTYFSLCVHQLFLCVCSFSLPRSSSQNVRAVLGIVFELLRLTSSPLSLLELSLLYIFFLPLSRGQSSYSLILSLSLSVCFFIVSVSLFQFISSFSYFIHIPSPVLFACLYYAVPFSFPPIPSYTLSVFLTRFSHNLYILYFIFPFFLSCPSPPVRYGSSTSLFAREGYGNFMGVDQQQRTRL